MMADDPLSFCSEMLSALGFPLASSLQCFAFPSSAPSAVMVSGRLPSGCWCELGVKELLLWWPPQGCNAGKLRDPGSVVRVMSVSSLPGASLVIAGSERARDKVRGEMSGTCISLCLSTPTWPTWKADLVVLSEVLCTQAPRTTQENLVIIQILSCHQCSPLIKYPNWGCCPSHCFFPLTI